MRAIVFALRGCPAGWLGAYGNEWVGTPNLDRVAAEGVVFDRHVSDCPEPDAAGRAWLTGRHQLPPTASGRSLGENAGPEEVPPPPAGNRPHPSDLLHHLKAAGAHTVVVRANHPDTDAIPSFYDGWGEVFDARPSPTDNSPLDTLIRDLPSLLDRLGNLPRWLIWIETDRLLPPWDVPQDVFEAYLEDLGDAEDDEKGEEESDEEDADDDSADEEAGEEETPDDLADEESVAEQAEPVVPYADPPIGPFDSSDVAAWEWLQRTFAAVVTTLDAELNQLFEEFRSRGLDQTATWIVTSDLGFPLGEHGQVGADRPWLYEELVHLPLLVRLPAAAEAGRRVWAFTQPADLAPTVLDLLGAEGPAEHFQGYSLMPLIHGQTETLRPYACSGLESKGVAEWAIRTDQWAYLLPGEPHPEEARREPMLFERPDDRWEVNNTRPHRLELADQLEGVLRKFAAAVQRPGPLVVPGLEVKPTTGDAVPEGSSDRGGEASDSADLMQGEGRE